MLFKWPVSQLFALIMGFMSVVPSFALPTVYTDRAAFNAAVEDYSLLTLDAPTRTVKDISRSLFQATYDDRITFDFDLQGGVGVNPGSVTMGVTGLQAMAVVLQPVTAFGFDVISGSVLSTAFSMGNEYKLSGRNFLGFVSNTPFAADLAYFNTGINEGFTIDNVAIQAMPEPSADFLLLVSGILLIAMHFSFKRSTLPLQGVAN